MPTATPTPVPVYTFVAGSASIKLASSDSSSGKLFGTDVAIDGDTVVASVHADFDKGTNAGASVVFTRADGAWTEQAKLIGDDTGPGDLLGQSVGLSGDTVVLGAAGDTPMGTDSGAAYVFTRTGETWTEQTKLTGTDQSVNSMFGWSVAIEDDTAAAGALNDEASSARTGGVWEQQARLTASDAAFEHTFGPSVALSGATMTVGAPGNAANGANTGAAYVFLRTEGNWSEQTKLTASDAITTNNFGWSVSVSNNTVAIGAFGNAVKGADAGALYTYKRSGSSWSEQAKLTATSAAVEHKLGTSISISGNDLVAGAPGDFQKGTNTGAAHVFIAQIQ